MKNVRVSSAVIIHDLGPDAERQRRFVITNEATGQHFSADVLTVRMLEGLRHHGDVARAALNAGIHESYAGGLLLQLSRRGIVFGLDDIGEQATPSAPIEGKIISVKADLWDASRFASRLSLIGRVAFSWPAAVIWTTLVLYAIAVFLENGDKVTTSLREMSALDAGSLLGFVSLFVGVKALHELGHILAYRTLCVREGVNPGPIRVGIMVFAATPFPFTDVTGAWRIASRWRRAMIGAAGIYFETFTVALLTVAWANLDLGSLEPVILQVAVFSGALTLFFNLNPAVKLDGYYILTDIFRQPNLLGRASQAARATFGRLMGAELPRPKRLELGYWVIVYAYRWTIFAGVFWLAYQFDPRLSGLVGFAAVMLLVVRPFWSTLKGLAPKLSRMRLAALSVFALVLIALAFVPFRARLLTDGQLVVYTTEHLRPPEASMLASSSAENQRLSFEQPTLEQDKMALETRLSVLTNLSRRAGLTAAEIAALESDKDGIAQRLGEVSARIERLAPIFPADSIVLPVTSDQFEGQWIDATAELPLATVSRPSAPLAKLTVAQNLLEPGLSETLTVRMVGAPDCAFSAKLTTPWSEAVAREGEIEVEAAPDGDLPRCAQAFRSGAAVVARFPLPPRSFAERVRRTVERLLQERLPFEREI